ncbi:MAG: right-handed parallel beta-helix repeat-containing protein [Xanthomonadales bacterium]|nr:right-handed parallel beta-helix repeat-containing protein [Xanthomonadales bacterium]
MSSAPQQPPSTTTTATMPVLKPLTSAMARALPGGLLLAAGLLLAPSVMAATYPVSNNNDSGAGSLRDAIGQANASVGVADTITFAPNVTGTITLTSGNLQVTDPVDIQGPGAAVLTVSGAGIGASLTMGSSATTMAVSDGGVFSFESPYSGNGSASLQGGAMSTLAATASSISGLTISGGYANEGGGIYVDNTDLTVDHCVVTGNSASNQGGGIWVEGYYNTTQTLTVLDSVISNNAAEVGGGLGTNGSVLTIQRSSIEGNSATATSYYGGGGIYIHNDSSNALTLDASTVSGNHSGTTGGGIFIRHSSATISNSTIAGNTAATYSGGGIYTNSDPTEYAISISNSTVTGNSAPLGGGVSVAYDDGSVAISNSVIADNLATTDPDLSTDFNSVFVIDHSLVKDVGTAAITDNGGNVFSSDPLLGPLQDNGGPTLTRLPLAGSPLIDVGDPAFTGPPTTDQRGAGFARIVNGVVDIGATEYAAAAPPVVTQTVPVPGLDDAGKLGLGLLLGFAGLAVARRRRDPLEPTNAV